MQIYTEKLNPLKRRLFETNVKIMGAPIGISANVLSLPVEEVLHRMQSYISENTVTANTSPSGNTLQTEIPIQIEHEIEPLKKWNWGAFTLGVIWGIGNKVWISLLILVPVIGPVMPFLLGWKGNEWAWKANQWKSIEEFESTQQKWAKAGFIVLGVSLVLLLMIAIFALLGGNDVQQ